MQLRKGHRELTVLDAVDNLALMAELDAQLPEDAWRDPKYRAYNQERVKETFLTLLKYVKEISERKQNLLREEKMQRGIQAIMLLAQEAAKKVDEYTQIFKGEKIENVTDLKEFKELQHFYLTKIVQRYQPLSDVEEKWQEGWGMGDLSEVELKDLETVRKDRDYELFFIRKEDGTPYFNRSLLYHMQLVGQFDAILSDRTMEDPFLRIHVLADKDAHAAAKEILSLARPYADVFFKDAMKFKNVGFVNSLGKAMMALLLAANNRNLIQNAVEKSSINYYADFQLYLRQALTMPEYQKGIAKAASSERFLHAAVQLAHMLCNAFFLRADFRKELIALIHALIEKGSQDSITQSQTSSPLSLWNNLLDKDANIRILFKQYPSGPLLKTIHLFEENGGLNGFDPIKQTTPAQLFTATGEGFHMSCIRLPCPTSQLYLSKPRIIEEFEGFLRSLQVRNQRHLLINVQNRTSWQEHARCEAMESKKPEFANALVVVGFPKDTAFYTQSGEYIEWDDAAEFMKALKEQVAGGEQCGFYLPPTIDQASLLQFTQKALSAIHTLFFGGKERLVRKNRLDFIEIFYLMLTLKIAEESKPDSFSFTCKDAIDTGAAFSAEMFAFLRMMNSPAPLSKEEADFLLWLFYAPALIARERAIDAERFSRAVSALAIIASELEAHFSQVVEACSKLYKLPFFQAKTPLFLL